MKRSYEGEELAARNSGELLTAPHPFDRPFPFFRKPQALGAFSLDGKRTFHHDRRAIKFYRHRKNVVGEYEPLAPVQR